MRGLIVLFIGVLTQNWGPKPWLVWVFGLVGFDDICSKLIVLAAVLIPGVCILDCHPHSGAHDLDGRCPQNTPRLQFFQFLNHELANVPDLLLGSDPFEDSLCLVRLYPLLLCASGLPSEIVRSTSDFSRLIFSIFAALVKNLSSNNPCALCGLRAICKSLARWSCLLFRMCIPSDSAWKDSIGLSRVSIMNEGLYENQRLGGRQLGRLRYRSKR